MKPSLIVGIAGLPGAGKTTLAAAVAAQLHARLFSFGNFFRCIAGGSDVQTFGSDYISRNMPTDVVDEFLRFYDATPAEGRSVIDGIRHAAIWRALRERTDCARLVFLDVQEPTLLARLMTRSKISLEEARRRLDHPVETEVLQLREIAEIVLLEPPQHKALEHLVDALADVS